LHLRLNIWFGGGNGIFQANYTYGPALDEVSNGGLNAGGFTSGSWLSPQDPHNLRGSYGPADYDVRHSFNADYVWEVPVKAALRGHGSSYLVNGWQLSGTIFARTGFPYTVLDIAEAGNLTKNNFAGPIYSVPVAPLGPAGSCGKGAVVPASPVPCQPAQMFFDATVSFILPFLNVKDCIAGIALRVYRAFLSNAHNFPTLTDVRKECL
jgi:hypothetical protein